jgi:hypothetical protein
MIRSLLALGLALLCLAATPAAAQISILRSPVTSPVIGIVMNGSTATTFSVSTAGVVSRVSGDAIRVSSSSVTPPTITLNCLSSCKNDEYRITVTATGASGDSRITRFRIGTLRGGRYRSAVPAEAASLTFDVRIEDRGTPLTFILGMDILLAAAANSGTQTFTFTVTATQL